MTLAKITAAIATIFIATAPPAPSWWKEITDEDMELLALHIVKADEITVRDSQTVTRLYFDYQVLQIFESINRQMIADKSTACATPQQIIEAIEGVRSKLKEQIVEEERKKQKVEREESTWRTYNGKDA